MALPEWGFFPPASSVGPPPGLLPPRPPAPPSACLSETQVPHGPSQHPQIQPRFALQAWWDQQLFGVWQQLQEHFHQEHMPGAWQWLWSLFSPGPMHSGIPLGAAGGGFSRRSGTYGVIGTRGAPRSVQVPGRNDAASRRAAGGLKASKGATATHAAAVAIAAEGAGEAAVASGPPTNDSSPPPLAVGHARSGPAATGPAAPGGGGTVGTAGRSAPPKKPKEVWPGTGVTIQCDEGKFKYHRQQRRNTQDTFETLGQFFDLCKKRAGCRIPLTWNFEDVFYKDGDVKSEDKCIYMADLNVEDHRVDVSEILGILKDAVDDVLQKDSRRGKGRNLGAIRFQQVPSRSSATRAPLPLQPPAGGDHPEIGSQPDWLAGGGASRRLHGAGPQQADAGAGAGGRGARPPPVVGGALPAAPWPVGPSQPPVVISVRLIAPSGKTRDWHLDLRKTVQDILRDLLPSELRGKDNVAVFNSGGNKIEPQLTIGDLAAQSGKLVLQFQIDDW